MRVAVVVLAVFAALWGASALVAIHVFPGVVALPLLISVALAAVVLRIAPPDERDPADARRVGRVVGLAIAGEVVAMIAGVNFLVWAGRPDLLAPLVAAVVGLHMLPMARWIPVPVYYATCAGMLAAAAAGLAFAPPVREAVVGGGAATVLWATIASFSLPRRRAPFAA